MTPGATGTPRMILRPGLRLGPSPDPSPRVLLTAAAGQSPTHEGGLILHHTTTITTTITKVGITLSLSIPRPAQRSSGRLSTVVTWRLWVRFPTGSKDYQRLPLPWYPIVPNGQISNLPIYRQIQGCSRFLLRWKR